MHRIRFIDKRQTTPLTIAAEFYSRTPTCSDSLAYRPNGGSSGSVNVGSYKSMSDVVVPGYHRRSARGEVFFNPCSTAELALSGSSSVVSELTSQTSLCSSPNSYYPKSKHTVTGEVGVWMSGIRFSVLPNGSLVIPSILNQDRVSSLRREVSTSCLNNIGRGDSNLYESLAEADKAIGTLGNIFREGVAMASSRGFAKAKNAANAYLALRYGLAPLMKDAEAVMLGLKALTGKVRKTYRAQGSFSETKTNIYDSSYLGSYTAQNTFVSTEVITLRAMSLNEYYASVMSNIGFTTKGLLTLSWELIPYSFVVDWFINVGDVLGSLVPDANMTQLGSCLTERRELTISYQMLLTAGYPGYNITTPCTANATAAYKSFSRSPGNLESGLVIRDDFRFSNLNRSLDALALLVQKIR